ncbi:TMV resistance protein N-like [Pyrus ussuriensis x Pyrus communis]|uniref:TMV resistance protein N-like n=1 Tax=Pyrus ussuriensis x Pyrus communis TaxID=2448454 RepID=A0A5N5FI64_9ROSA|nr:TMV resistance protein N-like [Pyrus ussuriensis x Pyrus communis]
MILEVTSLQASQAAPTNVFVEGLDTISPFLASNNNLPQPSKETTPPPPPSKAPGSIQGSGQSPPRMLHQHHPLPDLSPPTSSESHLFQNARQIFKDWTKRDFTVSFTQLMSKAQYESFFNFFENLRALRDQHHKAKWASNKVKCFQEKHVKNTATLRQLVEERSVLEERITVVDSEIQCLEE